MSIRRNLSALILNQTNTHWNALTHKQITRILTGCIPVSVCDTIWMLVNKPNHHSNTLAMPSVSVFELCYYCYHCNYGTIVALPLLIIILHDKRKIIINIYRPDHLVHQTQLVEIRFRLHGHLCTRFYGNDANAGIWARWPLCWATCIRFYRFPLELFSAWAKYVAFKILLKLMFYHTNALRLFLPWFSLFTIVKLIKFWIEIKRKFLGIPFKAYFHSCSILHVLHTVIIPPPTIHMQNK